MHVIAGQIDWKSYFVTDCFFNMFTHEQEFSSLKSLVLSLLISGSNLASFAAAKPAYLRPKERENSQSNCKG